MKIGIAGQLGKLGNDLFKELKKAGFDCNDFQMANTEEPPYTLEGGEFKSYLSGIKAAADASGIVINQVHGPWCWPLRDGTEEGRRERMQKMKTCLDAAAILGAEYMVIHPIMPCGIEERSDPELSKITHDVNVTFLRELAEYGLQVGVTVCLENMPFPDFSITTAEDVVKIIDEVNCEGLKMCLDTGHAAIFPDWQPDKSLKTYPEYIKTLHVHDNDGKRDEHRLPYYRGVTDWHAFGKALREVGFDGVLNLECGPASTLPMEIYLDMLKCVAKIARHIESEADR